MNKKFLFVKSSNSLVDLFPPVVLWMIYTPSFFPIKPFLNKCFLSRQFLNKRFTIRATDPHIAYHMLLKF